jgi:gluconolactonase
MKDMRRALFIISAALVCLHSQSQDFSKIKVEKIAGGFQFTEGPAWSREGYLLFSDVPANQIIKIDSKGQSVFRENSNGANGNTFDDKGRLYTCESRTRRVTRTGKKGEVEVLADKYDGKRLNAPNDIVVSKGGHVYFTDPAFGPAQSKDRELDFYGVYHISPKGELKLIAKPQGRPNGIVLSPDGKTLYVNNSDERNLRAYDVARDGSASNERVLVSNIDGSPDGMTVDEKGNIYITAKSIEVYSPEGKRLGSITTPEMPRNCTFGDGDLKTLYVTAMTSVYRIPLDVKGALSY